MSTSVAGSSGVVTSCGSSTASASASSGEDPPVSTVESVGVVDTGVELAVDVGVGDGTYDDCQLSLSLPPRSLLATKPTAPASPATRKNFFSLLPFFLGCSPRAWAAAAWAASLACLALDRKSVV